MRVERLAEAIAIIKGLFRPEPMNFAGKHYHISGLMGGIPAVQQPHPPLFVGGGGRRILTLAAREADIVGVTFTRRPDGTPNLASITSEAADEQVAWVRQVAGARFDSLELNILIQRVAVTDGADAADQAMEALSARWGLDRAAVEQSPHALIGSVPSLVEHLQERRERYGISYVAVFEPVMEALAPVVALLAGT